MRKFEKQFPWSHMPMLMLHGYEFCVKTDVILILLIIFCLLLSLQQMLLNIAIKLKIMFSVQIKRKTKKSTMSEHFQNPMKKNRKI